MERTLVIIKPDGVERKLIGSILKKIEDKNYSFDTMIMRYLSKDELMEHYGEHKDKEFFNNLINYMLSGKCIIMIVKGKNVIKGMRKIIGSTDPLKAEPGSIRGIYASDKTKNIIHASDSCESAERELKIFFN